MAGGKGLAGSTREEVVRVDHWTVDTLTRRLVVGGRPVEVGARAFDLLVALAAAPGAVVATDTLLQQLWPDRVVEDNNLHAHVSALRRVLGPDAIRTVRGRGYQLIRPPHTPPAVTDAPAGSQPPADRTATAPDARAGNLPHFLPPLIGRDTDLQRLQQLLGGHRTVTVTGAAGVGKTSLALAAARQWRHPQAGANGPWLVELAGAAEAMPLAEAVARVLGVVLPGLQPADDELVDVLRTRPVLLVLDNCEHRLLEAGHLVDRLARGTADVRVLATSQVALQHRSEQVFRLDTLALPRPQAPAAEARGAAAVALFLARAAQHDGGLTLDHGEQSLADVVAICEGLDGLPLAIELAAARVPLLGLRGLRERLGQPLALLTGGPRGAPERQQTLRGAIAWSHALLSDVERRAFRRLGIFAGSFSAAAARQVLDLPGDDEGPVLDLLGALLGKSLLVPPVGGPSAQAVPRLRLLESTRSFAREQLQACGEQPATALRLARAMLQLYGRDDGPRSLDAGPGAEDALAADLDNLRAALGALAAQDDQAQRHIELAGAVAWIWSRLGLRAEGLRRGRQALARIDASTPPRLEARLQLGWAALVHRRGEDGDSAAAARAAALYDDLGDRLGRFRALSVLAFMQALAGQEQDCMASLESLADTFDPSWGLIQWGAYTWTVAASLSQFGRIQEAVDICDRSIAQVEMLVSDSVLAYALISSAQLASMQEDFERAVEDGRRAVACARRAHAQGRLGMAVGDLACYLGELGRIDEALPLAREAVDLRGQDGTLGSQLDQLARLACARGRHREAAMALGRAEMHHRWRNGRRERYLLGPYQRATAAVAAALPLAEVQACHARGAAMGDDEVARLTLRD
jgi:predicted ATPase/DNA-binding winged helix-turn-helix (wHTH) protein